MDFHCLTPVLGILQKMCLKISAAVIVQTHQIFLSTIPVERTSMAYNATSVVEVQMALQGSIHQNIIRWFGAFYASPEFSVELLRDYTLYHNMKKLN